MGSATAARSDAGLRFDSEEQDRKVYFTERDEAIQSSPAVDRTFFRSVNLSLLFSFNIICVKILTK